MSIKRWLRRFQIRMDYRTLVKRGEWGVTPNNLLWCLDQIATFPKRDITKQHLKELELYSRSTSIDKLLQAASVYNISMAQRETLPPIIFEQEQIVPVTLDAFFVTQDNVPLSPEEVFHAIDHQLRAWIGTYCLLYSEEHPNFEYYERRSQWLFREFRDVLINMLVGLDPELAAFLYTTP